MDIWNSPYTPTYAPPLNAHTLSVIEGRHLRNAQRRLQAEGRKSIIFPSFFLGTCCSPSKDSESVPNSFPIVLSLQNVAKLQLFLGGLQLEDSQLLGIHCPSIRKGNGKLWVLPIVANTIVLVVHPIQEEQLGEQFPATHLVVTFSGEQLQDGINRRPNAESRVILRAQVVAACCYETLVGPRYDELPFIDVSIPEGQMDIFAGDYMEHTFIALCCPHSENEPKSRVATLIIRNPKGEPSTEKRPGEKKTQERECLSLEQMKKILEMSVQPLVNSKNSPNQESRSDDLLSKMFDFTSESLGKGYSDKLYDQISDAVVDAHLQRDPNTKALCETVTENEMVLLYGNITSMANIDYKKQVNNTINHIGCDDAEKELDYKHCNIIVTADQQSYNIAARVHLNNQDDKVGAGNQGLMFDYATDETEDCLPLIIVLVHKFNKYLADLRWGGKFRWVGPDSKIIATFEDTVSNGACIHTGVHSVITSIPHSEHISLFNMGEEAHIFFVVGRSQRDTGLTGKEIIVDIHGGWGAYGREAFSGNDFMKVDHSTAYTARWVKKLLVKPGVCKHCLIQVSYAFGIAEPLSKSLSDYGTSGKKDTELLDIINRNFCLCPGQKVKDLDLRKSIYQVTSTYGNFQRDDFTWEKLKKMTLY